MFDNSWRIIKAISPKQQTNSDFPGGRSCSIVRVTNSLNNSLILFTIFYRNVMLDLAIDDKWYGIWYQNWTSITYLKAHINFWPDRTVLLFNSGLHTHTNPTTTPRSQYYYLTASTKHSLMALSLFAKRIWVHHNPLTWIVQSLSQF